MKHAKIPEEVLGDINIMFCCLFLSNRDMAHPQICVLLLVGALSGGSPKKSRMPISLRASKRAWKSGDVRKTVSHADGQSMRKAPVREVRVKRKHNTLPRYGLRYSDHRKHSCKVPKGRTRRTLARCGHHSKNPLENRIERGDADDSSLSQVDAD